MSVVDFTADDERHAREALALALRGAGRVAPNPMVGAVVVRDGEVVGRGFHVLDERHHAEIVALAEAGERARGATLHVSLEPCSSHGRTPPCTDAILASGIARVVACHADPDPRHAGAGLGALRARGLRVEVGLLREEAARMNARWLHRLDTDRAHVTVKLATSLDGRIASGSGGSRWITGPRARQRVQELRRLSDAVLVGVGTVVADDPLLTLRAEAGAAAPLAPGPWRIVLDPRLRTPPEARILRPVPSGEAARGVLLLASEGLTREASFERRADTLRAAGAEILLLPSWTPDGAGLAASTIAEALAERGLDGVLVEGGGVTAATFLSGPELQSLVVHVAPIVLGDRGTRPAASGFGAQELADARRFRRVATRDLGPDLELELEPELGWSMDVMIEDLLELESSGGA